MLRKRFATAALSRSTILALAAVAAVSATWACDGDDDQTGPIATAGKSSGGGAGGATSGAATGGIRTTAGTSNSAGSDTAGQGGDSGGVAGSAGGGGAGGEGGTLPTACVFHTPAEVGGAGSDSGGAPAVDVDLLKSRAIGAYLTDGSGRTLYMFGSDVPGDCANAPVTACTGACTTTWPSFSAGSRALAVGVSDAELGDFTPASLPEQSTYHGWPLYTYASEEAGQLLGQGIATLWHAVKVPFYNVMLMKKSLGAAVTVKYISDGEGFALYRSTSDTVSDGAGPLSACDASCSREWPPFTLDRFILPSSFAGADFSLFLRGDGRLQVAYRGAPLYRSALDQKPGDTLGNAVSSFVLADPAL